MQGEPLQGSGYAVFYAENASDNFIPHTTERQHWLFWEISMGRVIIKHRLIASFLEGLE